MNKGIVGGAATILLLPVLFVVVLAGGSDCSATASGATSAATSTVDTSNLPVQTAGGYSGVQLENAAYIMNAAQKLGLPVQAQVIGVMTAMGESSLQELTYGDAAGPDSRGLFQQRANGAWGSLADRMDPTISATNFFKKLETVQGWQSLEPTIAAHRVQGNADPNHYTPFYAPAVTVVSALSGVQLAASSTGDSGDGASSACAASAGSGNYAAATGTPPAKWGGYDNGQIPQSQLAPIPWTTNQSYVGTMYLRPDAITGLTNLDNAFKAKFGYDIPINAAYRDLAGQVAAKNEYGGGAATPGQSNHGWALAVDIGTTSHNRIAYNDATWNWLVANAGTYGWVEPPWAQPGGVGPHEAWHWEFYGVKAS